MLYFYSALNKRKIIVFLVFLLVVVGVYQSYFKRLPDGLSLVGEKYTLADGSVTFLTDETYMNTDGGRMVEQSIFNEVFRMIGDAKEYVLVDMFLYNDFQGFEKEKTRGLSSELTSVLVSKKKEIPDILITVISDPINTIYGGQESKHFKELEKAGINVVVTNLVPLRDGNPIYSSFWRVFVRWFGNSSRGGFITHPFQYRGYLVTIRSYLSMLNFKANHRKLIVVDDGLGGMQTLIASANPHDGSSAHSNSAIFINGGVWSDVIDSERAVGTFSGKDIEFYGGDTTSSSGNVIVQLLTEGAIKSKLIAGIDELQDLDSLYMVMFYLSDREIIKALKRADERGVSIRIVLDPNKDAFGHEKNGIPNRPVASELLSNTMGNTQIRWCDTQGEQCHAKMVILKYAEKDRLILGSANFTRRNLNDYNLETDVLVEGSGVTAIIDAKNYFDRIWKNEDDRIYTTSYDKYAEDSILKTILYLFMEVFGTSTF